MRLTMYTDYGLRTLIYLALHPVGSSVRPTTVREIAEAYDISRNHLVKVAQKMVHEGYVEAARGRSGGIRLAMLPERIVVGDVVRRMEEDLRVVECFDASGSCCLGPACTLKHALRQALDAFLHVLDGYTLADLCAKPDVLIQLFPSAGVQEMTGRSRSTVVPS